MDLAFLLFAAPGVLFGAAGLACLDPGLRPRVILRGIEAAAVLHLALAGAGFLALLAHGPQTAGFGAAAHAVLSARLDAVSAPMLLLVSFIGWVVVRFAATYLDGEARQGAFMGWLCGTLGCVDLLILSGNLVQLSVAWVATSLFLHRLLLFYPERAAAVRAARKKFVVARLGDGALLGAVWLLGSAYGTMDIATICQAARGGAGGGLALAAAGLLACAALLKSAQFPTQGWLTEVMEAPTPVSALLHAGVINAGGFLLIRLADVMLLSQAALAGLVMIGGFTALFGGLVMLTQPAVKTSLAWSTVAQMGFMILECGLALFPLALLHIIAHSLYKAHAFLASGGAVEIIAANKRPGPVAVPRPGAVGRAFVIALLIYVSVGLGFGFLHKSPQAVALGAILIFGVAYLLAQGLADAAPRELTARMTGYAVAASLSYFALHAVSISLTAGALPAPPPPTPLAWVLMTVSLISFGGVAVAQAMFPLWAYHPAAAGLRVHLSNGFYMNAIADRVLGGWARPAGRITQGEV